MRKNLLLQTLCVVILFIGFSCSDDDEVKEPAETITLNMLNEDNGKTTLGESDLYINNANNFAASVCLISHLGKAGGIGTEAPLQLNNLTHEISVTPGHIYQVFDPSSLRVFPSNTRAIQIGASYYRLYVASPISTENIVTGAIVKYIEVYPEASDLPEYNYNIGEVDYAGASVSMKLPKNTECFWYGGVPEVFDLSTEGGTLQANLKKTPTEFNGIRGDYEIYIRSGNVYTCVTIRVK